MDFLRLIWLEIETGLLDPWLIAFFLFTAAGLCLFFVFFGLWTESNTYKKVFAQSTVVLPPQPTDFTASLVTALLVVALVGGMIFLILKDLPR
jgi:hypothetical protein